jgi:hypothetical protein
VRLPHWSMKTNPILHRITRGRKPNYLLAAIIIIVIGCLMMAASLINQPYRSLWVAPLELSRPRTYALSLLLMGMVISLSMTTTAIYHGQILPKDDSLLRTTLITDRQIMFGWVLGVLHRGVYWLSATVGAMIFATIISTINDIFIQRPGHFLLPLTLSDFLTLTGSTNDILLLAMLLISGVFIGMLAALRFRQTGMAQTVSGVTALMLMASIQIAVYGAQGRIINALYAKLMPFWRQFYNTYMQAEFLSAQSVILLLRVAFTVGLIALNITLLSVVKRQLRRLFPTTAAA